MNILHVLRLKACLQWNREADLHCVLKVQWPRVEGREIERERVLVIKVREEGIVLIRHTWYEKMN